MSTKNRTRRTTTRNVNFSNQMIEQINIALEQKGSKISQPGSLKRTSVNVERHTIVKVMKENERLRDFFCRTGRYCKFT